MTYSSMKLIIIDEYLRLAFASLNRIIVISGIIKPLQNPYRNIRGFELKRVLIIISCGLKHIGKRGYGLQVICTYR
jgi:hypothetical protein